MARVRLRRSTAERGDLPPACMRCGEPSTVVKARTFSWHPSWVYVLLVAGVLPFLIVALIMTQRIRVLVPLCDAHKNHWLTRNLVIWTSFFGLAVLGAGSLILMGENGPGRGNDPLPGYLCGGVVVCLIIWVFVAAVLQTTAIRPAEVTDGGVTLIGVGERFVEAVREERELDQEEWDSRRRPRDRYEDDDDDDDDPPGRRRRRRDDE